MPKLSKTQLAMLQKFDRGDKLHEMRGLDVHFFWAGDPCGNSKIRYDTVYKLGNLGLIEDIKPDWKGGLYAITDAGRRALAEQGGNIGQA